MRNEKFTINSGKIFIFHSSSEKIKAATGKAAA
jgi:hypothetical protein